MISDLVAGRDCELQLHKAWFKWRWVYVDGHSHQFTTKFFWTRWAAFEDACQSLKLKISRDGQ